MPTSLLRIQCLSPKRRQEMVALSLCVPFFSILINVCLFSIRCVSNAVIPQSLIVSKALRIQLIYVASQHCFMSFFRQIYIKISEDLGILFDSNGAFNFCLLCCCVLLKTLLLQLPDGCQVSMSCWLDPGDRTVLIHHPFTVNKTTDQKSSRRSASQVSGESWHNGLTFWKIIEII